MWNFFYPTKKGFFWKLVPLILLVSSFFLQECTNSIPSYETLKDYHNYKIILENATKSPPQVEGNITQTNIMPLFKELSPLKKRINVAFYQEHYENILFFLSLEEGFSLIIDPEVKKAIPPEKEKITLQMKNQPLEDLLKAVCEVLDLHYSIEKGILRIQAFEEKTFNLGFLPVIKEGKTSMGGDVLGNIGQAGVATAPIKGEFSVQANLASENLDIYSILEQNLSSILTQEGVYSLNKLTGSLYIKDKPSRIRTAEKLIEEFKRKYRKQIILDAKIIEIELSKGHNLGVDWFEISNLLLGTNRVALDTLDLGITTRSDQPSFALTISGQPNINLLLNLLKEYGEIKVVSNPKIRVLHSQPALISVGTSQSYIKEFKRDIATGTQTSTITYTTQTSSVFDGILLGITPFIADENDIILHIVPIKSDLIELKDVKFGADYFITLPKVNLREMTSIIKAKPNDLIVIGGLILDKTKNTEKKVALPFLSELFKHSIQDSKKAELVILIRVIVN